VRDAGGADGIGPDDPAAIFCPNSSASVSGNAPADMEDIEEKPLNLVTAEGQGLQTLVVGSYGLAVLTLLSPS
jgi:hypothetical protein